MPRISSTTAVKQPSVANHRARSKPAWSDYLTEDNRFALTKAEVLRRKKTLLSKNNIFKSVSKTSIGTSNHQNNQSKRDVKSQRFEKANMRSDSLSSCVDDGDDVRSQAPDALDFVAKKSICW
jgi:hypothetical protein